MKSYHEMSKDELLQELLRKDEQFVEGLHRSDENYRAFFMSVDQGVYLAKIQRGADGKPCDYSYLDANPAFERMIGFSRDQIIGKSSRELFPEICCGCLPYHLQLAKTETSSKQSFYSEAFQRHFEALGFRMGNDVIAVLVTDVTERKLAEQALADSEARFRLVFERAPAGLAMFDLDMRYIFVSRRWKSDYGLEDIDVIGLCHYDLFPEIGPEWIDAHKRGLAGEVVRSDTDCFHRSDGSLQWVSREIRPWYDGAGAIGGIVIFAEEISERVQMQDALIQHQKELRLSNELLEQRVCERTAELKAAIRAQESFSYSVSHDLRAPLRHINSFSAILAEDHGVRLEPEALEYLDKIRGASNKMGSLIDHLLELSRVTRTDIKLGTVSLSELAAKAMRMFHETEPERRVEHVIEQGIEVLGDAALLSLLLQNLLENAWKYTSRQAVARIQFGTTSLCGMKVYYVKDNGAGFDMAHENKLFQPFERLHGSEFEGIGIGLATALQIINRHGGKIWAEGKVGHGATVYFTLPAHF